MILLSQLDRQWSDKRIGNTPFKIGRWGCTITSLCMIESKFYPTESLPPPEAARLWSFNSQGMIIWSDCPFECFEFIKRGYGNDKKKIKEYTLDSNKGVILEVNNSHWVAVESWDAKSNTVAINDPFGGTHYNILPSKYTVTGYALFKKINKYQEPSTWALKAIEKASNKGVIVNWINPKEKVTNSRLKYVFKKLGALEDITAEFTMERLAVVLDNLKLLD